MKRMIIGGFIAGIAFLLHSLIYIAGVSTLESTQGFAFLIFFGFLLYFSGKRARKKTREKVAN